MSLFKGPDGIYLGDIRVAGVGRIKLSMRTRRRDPEGQERYDAVRRLFREAKGPQGADRRALIEQLRTGELPVERLASMVASGEPLVPVRLATVTAAAWPTVDAAIDRYVEWMQLNPRRRTSTWEGARSALRSFAAFEVDGVRLGGLAMDAVTSTHVEAYQRSLIATKAANTASGYIVRVGALWSWVQRREQRAAIEGRRGAASLYSPLDPEVIYREQVSRDRWLTAKEAAQLLEAAPPRLRFPIAAGLFGGFRIGEILSLRTFVDVDLELGTISVSPKQIGVDRSGAAIMWKPKTKRSNRVVPIATDLRSILEDHIATFASDAWVMPSQADEGTPFPYNTFVTHFTTVVENAGLVAGRALSQGVTFHTLRHTFASWMMMSGQVDLYTLAQLLGDTLQVVEDTYAHLAPDFKRRAIEAIKGTIDIPAPTEVATT